MKKYLAEHPHNFTPEYRLHLSEAFKKRGRSHITPEYIEKLKTARRGKKPGLGRTQSPEERELRRKIYIERPDFREKIRAARLKQTLPLRDTSIEREMHRILEELGIRFEKHRIMSGISYPYQCDIFIPEHNIIIEVDGIYHHAHPSKYPNPTDEQKKQMLRDKVRTEELTAKGYTVLRFWGDLKTPEINEVTAEIVSQRLNAVVAQVEHSLFITNQKTP